ncbi:MAG: hypothetical protein KKG10_14090, partial [Proteobacteria bacterium]|nr:hypothetical protein [Pseudomonadota bacterium]
MANADDLGRLAQEVANAYEERIQSISNIKRDTAAFLAETREEITDREIQIENMLAEFNDAREKMGREIRAELAKVKPELEGAESERKATDQAEIKEREAYVENLLSDFDEAHQEMAEELRAKLASDEKTRKTETQAEIKEREAYIEDLLADFDKAHQEMAEALRAELAKVKPELDAAESDRKKADQAEIKEREAYVENLLSDFDKAHQEMAEELRAKLAGDEKTRKTETQA